MLKFNDKTPRRIKFNGKNLQELIYNGVTVYLRRLYKSDGRFPITLEKAWDENLNDYKIYGESVQGILPDGYTQLEYIESTGTQYIDTGYKANINTTKFIGSFLFKDISQIRGVLGSRNIPEANNQSCNIFIFENQFRFDWFSGGIGYKGGITLNTKYEIEITAGYRKVNGIETRTSYTSPVPIQNNNFYIGNFSNAGSTPYALGLTGYIYECSLYDNDILVRNLIPAKRNSDGVIGMYDLVTNTFFTNAGTGTFTAGATAPTPQTPLEIESVGEQTKNIWDVMKYTEITSGSTIEDNKDGTFSIRNTKGGAIATYKIPVEKNKKYRIYIDEAINTSTVSTGSVGQVIKSVYDGDENEDKLLSDVTILKNSTPKLFTPTKDFITVVWTLCGGYPGISSLVKYPMIKEFNEDFNIYEPYGYRIPIKTTKIEQYQSDTFDLEGFFDGLGKLRISESNPWVSKKIYVAGANRMKWIYSGAEASSGAYIVYWNTDDTSVNATSIGTFNTVRPQNGFDIPSDAKWIGVSVRATAAQLSSSWEVYTDEVTNIYLNEPLRKISDYADYIDFKNKKVVRNIYKDEQAKLSTKDTSGVLIRVMTSKQSKRLETNMLPQIKSNKYITKILQQARDDSVPYAISQYTTAIYVKDVDLLDNYKVDDYLDAEIFYVLATPTEESIELPDILLNKGDNIISVETKIQPSKGELEYWRGL